MYDPPHPGGVIRRQWLDPQGISITSAAKNIGVSRKTLSKLVNEKSGINRKMAAKLSIAFNTSSEIWMNMQFNYDKKRKK